MTKIPFKFAAVAFALAMSFSFIGTAFADSAPVTGTATAITTSDATLNGTIGDTDASGHSFWVSTSTIDTSTTDFASQGAYSSADFGAIASSTAFSAQLSSIFPSVTPNTTYNFVAWANVGGTWTPGAVEAFTTAAPIVVTHPVEYVDGSVAVSGDGSTSTPFKTIQEGVDAVDANGTVYVASSTYAGGVTIGKSLTLQGATGATFTSGDPAINIGTTDAVTVDGFTFDGTGRPVSTVDGGTVTISHNVIKNTVGNATLYFSNTPTFTFTDNELTNLSTGNDEGIFLAGNWNGTTGTHVTITGNNFHDSNMTGMNLSNVTGTIANNTFSHIAYYGILLANNTAGVSVTGNTFDHIIQFDPTIATYGSGVRFYTPSISASGTVDISNNTFSNSYIGVGFRDPASDLTGQISAHNNIFESNTYNVYHNGTGTVDFSNNYWGFATGPAIGTIAGNASSSVIVSPFCVNSTCTPVPVVPPTTPAAPTSSGPRSGGNHNNAPTGTLGGITSTAGQVLGAQSYNFAAYTSYGSRSDEVVQIQTLLKAAGYFTYPTATGYFGPYTLAAVKAFQTANGITATGYVGPLTVAALNAWEAAHATYEAAQ